MSDVDAMNNLGHRDAIHVPFIMVTCDAELQPGEKVSLRHNDKCVRWGGLPESDDDFAEVEPMWHGVADPFSEGAIPAGRVFAVFIRKECFTGLRHDFQIEVHDRGGTATCHLVCDIF